jgi:phosphoglycerate dehydrogenase-like enzyme
LFLFVMPDFIHGIEGNKMASPHIFFMAQPGFNQEWFWRGRSCQRARELDYVVQLNTREGPLEKKEWAEMLTGVEALLTTWGTPRLDEQVLAQCDALRIVGHVGGSVAGVVSPELYKRGVKVCTANGLMARTVAEWALMMTLVALRQLLDYAQFGAGGRKLDWAGTRINTAPEDAVIGVWGYGDVARRYIELLRPFKPAAILVHDDFISEEKATREGIEKVALEDLFARADVIHCLTGLTPENKGRVTEKELALIKSGATLINCGRAPLIQEDALIAALSTGRFAAIMDVFESEPLAVNHVYRSLPNVLLTPHNAGCGRDELYLATMLDEFDRFFRGEPLQTEVTWERAKVMTDSTLLRGKS